MKRILGSLLSVIFLLTTLSVYAVPRRERDPLASRVVKVVKRVLGIGTNGDGVTPPVPPPCTGSGC